MKFNFFPNLRPMISGLRVTIHPELYRKAYCPLCKICTSKIITRSVKNRPWRLQKACSICATPYSPSWNWLIWGKHPSKQARRIMLIYDWSSKSAGAVCRKAGRWYNTFHKTIVMGRARTRTWQNLIRKAATSTWAHFLGMMWFLLALLTMLL